MPTHLLFFGMWEIGVLTGPLENACSSAPWRCSLAFLPGSEQGSIRGQQVLSHCKHAEEGVAQHRVVVTTLHIIGTAHKLLRRAKQLLQSATCGSAARTGIGSWHRHCCPAMAPVLVICEEAAS